VKRRQQHGRDAKQHGTGTGSALFGEERADWRRSHDSRKWIPVE
jgi:hypothetical protein